jgi:hypothetical protein
MKWGLAKLLLDSQHQALLQKVWQVRPAQEAARAAAAAQQLLHLLLSHMMPASRPSSALHGC